MSTETDVQVLLDSRRMFSRLFGTDTFDELINDLVVKSAELALTTAVEDFKSVYPSGSYEQLSKYLSDLDIKSIINKQAGDYIVTWSEAINKRIANTAIQQKLLQVTNSADGIESVRLRVEINSTS